MQFMKTASITLCGLAAWLAGALAAGAAPAVPGARERHPHIGYLCPAGGRRGTNITVKVGGEYITGSTAALVSGTGVTAQVVAAGERLDDQKAAEKKKNRKKNQTVLDEVVSLNVTIAPDAEVGNRLLRLVTPDGLSDPLRFQVGEMPEVQEVEPNDKTNNATALSALPVVANGQILSGDIDLFKFPAQKGQHLVIEVAARALIPYLADAVPGWFQAVLSLHDAQGREVAYADGYRFNPDPVLCYDVPADGQYGLAIRDSIYRGRADFVYRIKIGEQPFVSSIFPLGARRGAEPVTVRLSGRNLPADTMRVDVSGKAPRVSYLSVTRDGLVSTPVPFAIDDLPEVLEDEASATRRGGQNVTLPVVINGRIRTPGACDTYRFDGKRGQRVCFEVHARRLGSPLDSELTLLDPHGGKLGENDDIKDKAEGLLTHVADSELLCALPEDGAYTVKLRDVQGKGGDEYAYRLQIAPPAPDFELRAVPASLSLPAGGSEALTVHAIRRCGFTNEIRLALDESSAPGCALEGGVIPAGADKVRVTVSAGAKAGAAICFPRLSGTAVAEGTPLCRPAVPAEDMMQAFAYQHLVPVQDCALQIEKEAAPFRVVPQLGPQGYLELPLGKETAFKVTVTRRPGFDGHIRLQLEDPPKGITLQKPGIPPDRDTAVIILRAESKVTPNLRENLILTGIMSFPAPAAATNKATGPAATHVAAATNAVAVKANAVSTGVVTVTTNTVATPPARPTTNSVASAGATNALTDAKRKNGRPARERVIMRLPALPIRTVDNPDKKKPEAGAGGKK